LRQHVFYVCHGVHLMATTKPAMSVEQALENIHEFGNGWYLCKASASACWASMVFAMQASCLVFQLTCVEDEWGLSTEWSTVITIVRVLGVLLSEFLLGPATDIYGRWVVLCYTTVVLTIMAPVVALATNIGVYLVLDFVLCFVQGSPFIAIAFLVEVAPLKSRGFYSNFTNIATTTGTLLSTLIAWAVIPSYGWRWYTVAVSVPLIPGCGLYWFTCESPRWLASQGQLTESFEALQYIAESSGVEVPCSSVLPPEASVLQDEQNQSFTWRWWTVWSSFSLSDEFGKVALLLSFTSLGFFVNTALVAYDYNVLAVTSDSSTCSFDYTFLTALACGTIFGTVLIGPFIDQLWPIIGGRRGAVFFFAVLSLVPTVLSGYTSFGGVYVCACLARCLVGGADSLMNLVVTEAFSSRQRATACSLEVIVGTPFAVLAALLIYSGWADSTLMWCTAGITVIWMAFSCLIPETAQKVLD